MQPLYTHFIKNNPSIDEVLATVKKVGEAGKNSAVVNAISAQFPYDKYKDKYQWLKDIFNYIDKKVQYRFDDLGFEQIKTPERFVVKDGAGDCDDYTTLWVAILSKHNIKHYRKIVKYRKDGIWAHIYVVVPATNGKGKEKMIVLDNVLKVFDKEVKHVESKMY